MDGFFKALDKLKPIYDFVDKAIMLFCKLLLTAEIVICSYVVFCRFIGRHIGLESPAWGEEIILTCMVYMALASAAMAVCGNAHIRMTAFDSRLPKRAIICLDILSDVHVMAFGFVMLIEGWSNATGVGSRGFFVSIPTLPKFWLFLPVPISGFGIIMFELETLYGHVKQLCGREAVE